VEPYSSIIGDAYEGKAIINADHMGMCRFSSRDDSDYQLVISVLKRWVQNVRDNKGCGPVSPALRAVAGGDSSQNANRNAITDLDSQPVLLSHNDKFMIRG
jgi:hypothetical protein